MRIRQGILIIFVNIAILMTFIFVITQPNQSHYFKSDFIGELAESNTIDDALLLMMGTEIPAFNAHLENNHIEAPDPYHVLFKLTTGITLGNFPSLMEAELPGLKSYALGINFSNKGDDLGTTPNKSSSPDFENLLKEDKGKSDDEKEYSDDGDEDKDKEKKQDDQTKQSGQKTLSGYHFVIDPGHGGKDTGAIGTEVYEKILTLSTAKKVEEQLRDKGASVTLTRADDTFIPLGERAQISNSTDTDAFISLHYNAAEDQSVHGIYTFYYDGDENVKLANSIQKSLINHVNLADRGAKQADYKVLRDNKQLALLIELGFLTNPEEQKLVQSDSYQEKAAEGIVAGLEDYFR